MPRRDRTISAVRRLDRIDGLLRPLRRAPPRRAAVAPREVLLWTVDRIGDVVRATAALDAVRGSFPHARITAVVADRALAVLQHDPRVDRIVRIARPHDLWSHRAAIGRLRRDRFDLGLLLEVEETWAKLGQLWFRRLGVERWAAFEHGLAPHPREARVPIRREAGWDALFVDLARAVGATGGSGRPGIAVSDRARAGARDALARLGIAPGEGFLLCHPGTSALAVERSWPPERFGRVIARLHRATGLRTAITGVAAEAPLARACIDAAGAAAPLDATGRLSLEELIAAIEAAALLLVNDTGPLHLANAVGTPAVAVLGPTAPGILGLDPSLIRTVQSSLPCQPCVWHGAPRPCPQPDRYACLRAVTEDRVAASALAALRPSRREAG